MRKTTIRSILSTTAFTLLMLVAGVSLGAQNERYLTIEGFPQVQAGGSMGKTGPQFKLMIQELAIKMNASYTVRTAASGDVFHIPFRLTVDHLLGEDDGLNFNKGRILLKGEFVFNPKARSAEFKFTDLEEPNQSDRVARYFGFNTHINLNFANLIVRPAFANVLAQIPNSIGTIIGLASKTVPRQPGLSQPFPVRFEI